jgi:DNA polymerase-3 subunit delta
MYLLVKNYIAASRNYSYGKVEQILLLIQEYNLKVIGIHNADNTDGDLLKELVIKIMDTPAK